MAISDRLFIDSSFFCSAKNKEDINHTKALLLFEKLQQFDFEVFTGTHILLEAATIISQQVSKQKGIEIIDELRSGAYHLIHPDESLLAKAEELFRSIPSKNVSYADCISFTMMKEFRITWTLSFDIHFKKQGFKRIGID